MSLKLIFHISDFHYLKIVNYIFSSFLRLEVDFCPGVFILRIFSFNAQLEWYSYNIASQFNLFLWFYEGHTLAFHSTDA